MNHKNDSMENAFGRIRLSDEKKKRIYYEIQRNFNKKGYVSNQKLHFFKQKFDRFVPALALLLILFCGFAYYGVASGLFTGQPFVSTEEMLDRAGYGAQDSSSEAAAQDGAAAGGNTAGQAEEKAAGDERGQAAKMDFDNGAQALTTAYIYAPMDVGYTLYVVSNIPQDGLVLWQQMESLNAVPAAVELEAYSLSDGTLTLDFNEELQRVQDASATTALITGIAKTYGDFYPESSDVVINAAGEPLTYNGSVYELDGDLILDITDRREMEYAP